MSYLRATALCFVLLVSGQAVPAWSADARPAAVPRFVLPGSGETSSARQFTPAQLAYVQGWLRQQAPEYPAEAGAAVAQAFLEELAVRQPDKLERLLAPEFSARDYDSMLLRIAGTKLAAAAQAPLREKIAGRRVAVVLAQAGQPPAKATDFLARLREDSSFQYRRLLEGRLEDDELLLQFRKAGQPAGAPAAAPAAPKTLTAADIVSEFSRHNQVGAAMQRLQAYLIEGRLTLATGEVQQLVISKMRPDRMRLVVLTGGHTQYTLAADRDRFWQQVPGGQVQVAAGKDMGMRRYLAEFADPMFAGDGFAFARLPDGGQGAETFYRIAVRRPDGSGYVSRIEPGTFRQIGRENEDQSIARYADFREIAGVTFPFREEITDQQGRKGLMVLTRVTPNPGLIEAYFIPLPEPGLDYYQLEKSVVRAPVTFGLPAGSP